ARLCHSGRPAPAARACASAIETARIAFAPRRPLLAVPSSALRCMSMSRCRAGMPTTEAAISPLTAATACVTPLPSQRVLSPSRFSRASRSPVEAPEGTAARPQAPVSRRSSASTVGLPRESRICRAWMACIFTRASCLCSYVLSFTGAQSIDFGFERKCPLVERTDIRMIVCGDHDNAAFADRMASRVFSGVVANPGAARDEYVPVDDRIAQLRVTPHAHAGHQNAVVDLAEAVDAYVRPQHTARHRAARDDAAGRDDRVDGGAAPAWIAEDKLRGGRLWLVRAQGPLRIVQIELGVHMAQVHVGLVVRVERADVAPVLRAALVLV